MVAGIVEDLQRYVLGVDERVARVDSLQFRIVIADEAACQETHHERCQSIIDRK